MKNIAMIIKTISPSIHNTLDESVKSNGVDGLTTSDAPVISTPVPDVSFDEDTFNDTLNLSNFFSDVDNTTLIFTADPAANLTVNITGSLVNVTADQDFFGTRNVTLTASDGLLNVSDIILVTVNPVNDAPVVSTPIIDITFDEDTFNDTLNLDNFFSDVDNTTLIYTANPVTNLTINILGSLVNITADPNFNGQRNVTFNASDGWIISAALIN